MPRISKVPKKQRFWVEVRIPHDQNPATVEEVKTALEEWGFDPEVTEMAGREVKRSG